MRLRLTQTFAIVTLSVVLLSLASSESWAKKTKAQAHAQFEAMLAQVRGTAGGEVAAQQMEAHRAEYEAGIMEDEEETTGDSASDPAEAADHSERNSAASPSSVPVYKKLPLEILTIIPQLPKTVAEGRGRLGKVMSLADHRPASENGDVKSDAAAQEIYKRTLSVNARMQESAKNNELPSGAAKMKLVQELGPRAQEAVIKAGELMRAYQGSASEVESAYRKRKDAIVAEFRPKLEHTCYETESGKDLRAACEVERKAQKTAIDGAKAEYLGKLTPIVADLRTKTTKELTVNQSLAGTEAKLFGVVAPQMLQTQITTLAGGENQLLFLLVEINYRLVQKLNED